MDKHELAVPSRSVQHRRLFKDDHGDTHVFLPANTRSKMPVRDIPTFTWRINIRASPSLISGAFDATVICDKCIIHEPHRIPSPEPEPDIAIEDLLIMSLNAINPTPNMTRCSVCGLVTPELTTLPCMPSSYLFEKVPDGPVLICEGCLGECSDCQNPALVQDNTLCNECMTYRKKEMV